jgi:hypothetical protein
MNNRVISFPVRRQEPRPGATAIQDSTRIRTPESKNIAGRDQNKSALADVPAQPQASRRESSSEMAQSLYELSIQLRPLDTVIAQIRSFKKLAPLDRYQYRELIDLMHASAECPPEPEFLFLSIATKMVKLKNYPDKSQHRELYDITRKLLQGRPRLCLYDGDQTRCRAKLKKMLALFAGQFPTVAPKRRLLKTSDAEKIVKEQQPVPGPAEPCPADQSDNSPVSPPPVTPPDEPRRNSAQDTHRAFTSLSEEQQATLKTMALWFVNWETAYQAALRIWEVVEKDSGFPVDALVSVVPLTFADFLLEVLKDCAKDPGGIARASRLMGSGTKP